MTENQDVKPKKSTSIIVDDDKNTSLHYSAASGNEEEVLKDLEIEPKIDAENYLGWTPLMMACKNGHLKVTNLLLQYRADATKRNKFGMSVFLISITSGNLELVHLILQHLLCGGVSRQSMQYHFSPLSISVLFCYQHILQYLIDQHFSLNIATSMTGITPLMFASAMENCEAFALLVTRGADVTLKNALGFTAHDITQFRNRKVDIKVQESTKQQSPMTMITKSPHLQPQQQIPYIIVSPQPSFLQLPANHVVNHHLRKSSNASSPNYFITTPNITPIPYVAQPQMFFPPEFSPTQYVASGAVQNMFNNSNDFLNARLNQSSMLLSPFAQANFASPCI